MKQIIITTTTILLLFSCTSTRKVMDSWFGHSKQELIMKWGPPSRTASDGGTGEILVYSKQIYIPAQSGVYYVGSDGGVNQMSGTPSRTYWQYKMFYLNSNGKIYHWLIQNQQVPPQQIDLNLYIRK